MALTVIARRGAAPSGALEFEDKASWPYQASIGAAVALIRSDVPEQLLRDLIVIFELDPEFGRRVMMAAGGQFGRVPVLPNAPCQILADYYLWARALAPAPVFRPDRPTAPSPEQHLRELILQRLIACTGTDALAAIERVAQLTGDPHLRGQARAGVARATGSRLAATDSGRRRGGPGGAGAVPRDDGFAVIDRSCQGN